MIDYAKLIDEEKSRDDSLLSIAATQRRREVEMTAFFKDVEIAIGEEMARANQELMKRGSPTIDGPFRPDKDQEMIELEFGTRSPCCRLTLQTAKEMGLARIQVELFDDSESSMSRAEFVIEEEASGVRAYRPLVAGFPDKAAELTAAEIAQKIVPGIIRGRFA
jgi:hypothetical protein